MAFFICTNCGNGSASWLGRCPSCGEFNTLKENRFEKTGAGGGKTKESLKKINITSLSKVQSIKKDRKKTGIFEFDRVLGGGIVPGAVILLTGEPGVGKSTLLLQALHSMKALYVSGEEAPEQVKDRAERLKINLNEFYFSSDLQVEGIVEAAEEWVKKIDVLVIDSIQTIYSKDIEATPGNISQLRESTAQLINAAKSLKLPIIIIGHVTKDGDIAGPKSLEHMVDTVLTFEGEQISQFRILRANKNRFGSTDEIGIFEMKAEGLAEVNNPLAFLEDQSEEIPGKAIVGIIEGRRPLFFEIQTLASPTMLAMPRRVVKGVDYNKVQLLLAVIRKHLNMPLDKFDIYVNVIGGVDIKSTAADLGIIASLVSSLKNIPLPTNNLFIGEVGLLGEVRKIFGEEKITSEAKRLRFTKIYSSQNTKTIKSLRTIFNQ